MSTLAERVKKWGDELNQQWLEKGIEQGIERGERRLVYRLADQRFGPGIAKELIPLVEELSGTDRIATVAGMVLECDTAEEFLERARDVCKEQRRCRRRDSRGRPDMRTSPGALQ